MNKNQTIIIVIFFTLGIIIGSMSELIGLNTRNSDTQSKLNLANEKITSLENEISRLKEENSERFIKTNLRIAELTKMLSDRERIRISSIFDDAPLFFNSDIVTLAEITECTKSMRPTFDCKDVVIVYEPKLSDIEKGDIIIFKEKANPLCERYTGERIIHRVENVHTNDGKIMFETKGDGSNLSDYCLVSMEDILWKIIAIVYNTKS